MAAQAACRASAVGALGGTLCRGMGLDAIANADATRSQCLQNFLPEGSFRHRGRHDHQRTAGSKPRDLLSYRLDFSIAEDDALHPRITEFKRALNHRCLLKAGCHASKILIL